MKTFITSDLHFGHKNILKFNPATRQHEDTETMIEFLVKDWNSQVGKDDVVYILGDVAFCNAKRATEILRSLNGHKHLIVGNHDEKLVQDREFCREFISIQDYMRINYGGNKIVMFHFPIQEWDQCHRGSIHFHGHCHGNLPQEDCRRIDVGVDGICNGRAVVQIETAIAEAMKYGLRNHGDSAENA